MREATCHSGRHRPRMVLALLITVVAVLMSGCLKSNVSLTISEDDRVSGEILAAVPVPAGQEPFRLRVPQRMADRVRATPYESEGLVGSKLSFTGLTFNEVEQLGRSLGSADSRYTLDLSRAGSLVTVEGSVDLTPLADTDSSVLIEINTPGEVTTTNGDVNAGVLSWRPEPGEVTEISATLQFANTQSATWFGWAGLVGGLTFGVALLVAVLALFAHRRMRREATEHTP